MERWSRPGLVGGRESVRGVKLEWRGEVGIQRRSLGIPADGELEELSPKPKRQ